MLQVALDQLEERLSLLIHDLDGQDYRLQLEDLDGFYECSAEVVVGEVLGSGCGCRDSRAHAVTRCYPTTFSSPRTGT